MIIFYVFILGSITGISIGILVMTTLIYFRHVIDQKIMTIGKRIENAGPRPKGFIVEPPSDADEIRSNIIKRNKSKGIDTKLEDLI